MTADESIPGSALSLSGWDRPSSALFLRFRNCARRRAVAESGDPSAGGVRVCVARLKDGVFSLRPYARNVELAAPRQERDASWRVCFDEWAALVTSKKGSSKNYHVTQQARSLCRVRRLASGPLKWAATADARSPKLDDVIHAFATAQAKRRPSHKPLDDIKWSQEFGAAHLAVHQAEA